MGKFSIIKKVAKKAGKWALSHPDEVMAATETGINIHNTIREQRSNRCNSSNLEQSVRELQNSVAELKDTIETQQKQITNIQNEYSAYRKKIKKAFVFMAIFTFIAIIVISGLFTFICLDLWLLL